MAAKLIHSLTDENADLRSQIGCMTGIFQLFDREHMLTGGRRTAVHGPRRIPPGNSHLYGSSLERESNNAHLKSSSVDKYASRNVQDRQRVSTESSRASFSSSSRSSSFSSLECSGAVQLEQTVIFSEIPSGDAAVSLQHLSPPQFDRQTIDLRGLVKDSMYREIHGLSVKSKTEEEAVVPIVKYRDSTRLQPKISDDSCGSGVDQRSATPADLKESLRALAKLQEVSSCRNETREFMRSSLYHFKDGSSFSVSKDAPRLSYDRKNINCMPYDSGDVSKTSFKFKDLPRLSLDSREGSMRSLNADLKSNILLKGTARDGADLDGDLQCQKHVTGNHARPPSVVAKLMGLETLPDSIRSGNINTTRRIFLDEGFTDVSSSSSFEKADQSKMVQPSSSSKSLWKEPTSPRWRSPDCSMKRMSRFPVESAPWKQIDGTKGSQKPVSKSMRNIAKASVTFPSVYGEIEKRLKDLELNQSGKDLRALKQILEAMQAKGLLENPQEGQDSKFTTKGDNEQMPQSGQVSPQSKRKVVLAQSHESPIVIMKPMKLVEKSGIPAASVISFDGLTTVAKSQGSSTGNGRASKDLILKSNEQMNGSNSVAVTSDRKLKAMQKSQQSAKEGNAGSGKNSGSISPRIQQQKKLEVEKRSRPPASPDSNKSTRQSNKQQSKSTSPGGRRKAKIRNNHQKSNDDLTKASLESRNLIPQVNEISVPTNPSPVQGPKSSSERSRRNSIHSPSKKAEVMQLDLKSTLMLNEEESGDPAFAPAKFSSPVSVLENVLCKQDSPPVKYIGKMQNVEALTESETNSNAMQQSSADGFAPISSSIAFEINRKKLRDIDSLVQKLQRLNSTHDEARTDYIASLCENTDPDHRYISEILLASGLLLRDLTSSLTEFQFHPSGHPINPELFLVLEQTKASNAASKDESSREKNNRKIHRKLIFDAVNEILAEKLSSTGSLSEPWTRPGKPARTLMLNAQKLLRDLCSEIDGLGGKHPKCSIPDEEKADDDWKSILHEDVLCRSGSWMEHDWEISSAVLDVERLIFKDLVNEVVIGESSAGLKAKPPKPK